MNVQSLVRCLVMCSLWICCASPALGDGACCLPDDSCTPVVDEAECGGLGGVFLDGADCADDACGLGACCNGDNCAESTAYPCIINGRTFAGAGTTCFDDPCDSGVGACCNNGDCDEISPEACAESGGTWLGAGTFCDTGICDLGSCCAPGLCADNAQYECDDLDGTFLPGATCDNDPCDVAFDCGLDSLVSQSRHGPDFFVAFTSEAASGFRRWDNYEQVAGAIDGVTWFGLDLRFADGDFFDCTESDNTFDVSFHEDDLGVPGAAICNYTLLATRTPTGIDYLGTELNEYHVDLPEACILPGGWISIVGLGDADCWFLWVSSPEGDNFSYCDNCTNQEEGSDLNFCIEGDSGGLFGACCDEATGVCNDDVEIVDCIGTGLRFTVDTLCAELDPACAQVFGACCIGDGTCSFEVQADCETLGGSWLGDGSVCEDCPPVGACCIGTESCSIETEEDCGEFGLTWAGPGTTCDECPEPPPCPEDSLFAQPADDSSDFLAGASEVGSGFRRYENFFQVGGAIDALNWAGLDLENIPGTNGFIECTEPDPTFTISFHEDAAGVPGEMVCSFEVLATRTDTGLIYLGAQLNEYVATLPESCIITNGWVSIVGQGDPECWFLWMSAGDGESYCEGCGATQEDWDFSLCLRGESGGVFGACCDDAIGVCNNEVDISACADPDQRFSPGQSCDELEPPCGVILGACCFADATCGIMTDADCIDQGGDWLGDSSICDSCPCLTPCMPVGIAEGEPVCGDDYVDVFNGGCDAELQVFSPIAMCDTICGEGGVFEQDFTLVAEYDWYEINLDAATQLTFTVEAEFPIIMAIVNGNTGCEDPAVLVADAALECETAVASTAVNAGTYWLVVGALTSDDLAQCGARYTATVTRGGSCEGGDLDGDGLIDLFDYEAFLACVTGPGETPPPSGCAPADLDTDGDIDFADFAAFQRAITLP